MENREINCNGENTVRLWNAVKLGGAFISTIIGSSFATGQASMQMFISQGSSAWISMVIAYSLLMLVTQYIMKIGNKYKLTSAQDAFSYLFGKKIGKYITWYAVLTMILGYTGMISGTAATINQFFGIPYFIGAGIMIFFTVISVVLGLKKMVSIIGSVGPIISILIIVIALGALLNGGDSLSVSSGIELAPTLGILKMSSSPILTGIIYVGVVIPTLVAVLPPISNSVDNKKEVAIGGIIGPGIYIITEILVVLGLFKYVGSLHDKMIPMLELAYIALPFITPFFLLIILMSIYSTATPQLWSVCSSFAPQDPKKFKVLAVLSGVGLGFGSLVLPFNKLINVIYPTFGVAGIIILCAIIISIIKESKDKHQIEN